MDLTNEIKSKEESLSVLMSRILREPLAPLNKSINDTMETLLDTKDILDEIDSSIKTSGHDVEKSIKSLRSSLSLIKDEVLPDHDKKIQRQFKTLSEATSTKVQESIDIQQQSIYTLKAILATAHDSVLGEINANKELSQRAFAALTQQCTASHESLAANLQKTKDLIGNSSIAQQRALDATHQTLLGLFGNASNDLRAIQKSITDLTIKHEVNQKSLVSLKDCFSAIYDQLTDFRKSSTNAIDANQAEVTRMLTEQNNTLTRHIASVEVRIKNLTLMAGFFFTSVFGYVAYDLWTKFN